MKDEAGTHGNAILGPSTTEFCIPTKAYSGGGAAIYSLPEFGSVAVQGSGLSRSGGSILHYHIP